MSGINPKVGQYIGADPTVPQYYKHGINVSIEELGVIATGTEDMAQAILSGVIDWVLEYTGMDTQYERREELDGTGNRRIMLAHYPCQQLLNVQIASRIDDWIDITRYARLLEHGELVLIPSYFHWVFPAGERNIRVRYIAGLTRIPGLMRLVIIELAQILLLKSGLLGASTYLPNTANITTVSTGTTSGTTDTASAIKGIREVKIESLLVQFSDDKRTMTDMLQRPEVLKMAISKMLDNVLTDQNSILKRLDFMCKLYTNN